MRMKFTDYLFVIIFAIATVAFFYVLLCTYERSCEERWKDSDFKYRYNAHAGCQVQVKGRWVPADAVRIDDK